jgi:hypothetical protein
MRLAMNERVEPDEDAPTSKEKAWAVLQLILGQAQVMGAVVAIYLLVETGVNALSLGATVVTCLLTTTSVLLFGGRNRKGR